jgi:hypothetical protein
MSVNMHLAKAFRHMKEAPADTWQLNVYYEGIEKDAWLHN